MLLVLRLVLMLTVGWLTVQPVQPFALSPFAALRPINQCCNGRPSSSSTTTVSIPLRHRSFLPPLPPSRLFAISPSQQGLSTRLTRCAPSSDERFTLIVPAPASSFPACGSASSVQSHLETAQSRLMLSLLGFDFDTDVVEVEAGRLPSWLSKNYGETLPALRHGPDVYVTSPLILSYLEFFFPPRSSSPPLEDPPPSVPSLALLPHVVRAFLYLLSFLAPAPPPRQPRVLLVPFNLDERPPPAPRVSAVFPPPLLPLSPRRAPQRARRAARPAAVLAS